MEWPIDTQCQSSDAIVTVVIATRNRTSLLHRALRSVESQSYENVEILIVDDGSDASTLEHNEAYLIDIGSRARLIRSPGEGTRGYGPSVTRNRGLFAANGRYVAFLDDDDEWVRTDHLDIACRMLQLHGGDYFFSDMQASRQGKLVFPGWFPSAPALRDGQPVDDNLMVYKVTDHALQQVLKHHVVHPSQLVIKADLARSIGGFWERSNSSEDLDFMYRAVDASSGQLYRDDVTANYRLPEAGSISLQTSTLDKLLQKVFVMQHARLTCRSRAVRRAACAREAWAYRELALFAIDAGQHGDGVRFAWQSFATWPTLGAAWHLAKSMCGVRSALSKDPRFQSRHDKHASCNRNAQVERHAIADQNK